MPSKDNIKSFDTAKRKGSASKSTAQSKQNKSQEKTFKKTASAAHIRKMSAYEETKREIKESRKIEQLQDKERERRLQKDEKELKRARKAEKRQEKERKKLQKMKLKEERKEAEREEREENVSDKVANEIIGIIVVGIGIFILMCLFNISNGAVGEIIQQCLRGLLGYLSFLLPVALILVGIVLIVAAGERINTGKLIAVFGAIAALAAFLQLFPYEQGGKFSDETLMIFLKSTYSQGLNNVGTGVLFSTITYGFVQAFEFLGAKFLLGLIFLALFLFITNISIKKVTDAAVKKLKSRNQIRREKEREFTRSEMRAVKPQPQREQRPAQKQESRPHIERAPKRQEYSAPPTIKRAEDEEPRYEEQYEDRYSEQNDSSYEESNYEEPIYEEEEEVEVKKPVEQPKKEKKNILQFTFGKKKEEPKPEEDDDEVPFDEEEAEEKPTIIEMSEFTGEKRPLNVTVDGEILDDGTTESMAVPTTKQQTLEYILPTTDLLEIPEDNDVDPVDEEEVYAKASAIEHTLSDFSIEGKVNNITHGPVITRYEYSIQSGTKLSKVTSLNKELAYSLECSSLRIEAPIPGKAAIGIEVPNKKRSTVYMSELLDSEEFRKKDSLLAFAVGKDIAGNIIVGDISKMPHTLISGATGSGKSVFINSILMSILFKASPKEVKFVMVDPKRVEFEKYRGIPHLMFPVVSNPKKAAGILGWCVKEMENRYDTMAKMRVRDIKSYNKIMREHPSDDPDLQPLPLIVIVIDELADLMVVARNEVEDSIYRLAQMARAAGMYLIIATQRPSVDVITGVIKANIPSRIALKVASPHDSRTIIDCIGAEQLLGNGDMIYKPDGLDRAIRVQGAWVSDADIENVVNFIKEQGNEPAEELEMNLEKKIEEIDQKFEEAADTDELLAEAIKFVVKEQDASVSMLQRRFRIGHYRAGSLIDEMEKRGIVGPARGSRTREVLVTKDEYELGFTAEDKE